ncbi:arylsulfatase [Allomuricauda sp. SCSIO 65647]|uniref:arylsulfatase n=1 Tax=Allomuricauda sp. SCSIO 65647 TaxID=2908843 RepID=UPI001F474740|nr:arylsulfatase [Muricauda sp. SCSIO 65647]UJH67059.1 arylsulfatase [Muricauda sp. SCSIO 65647]
MKKLKTIIHVVAIVFLSCNSNPPEKNVPPNVIIIMTDDQGYGEFSFNGNPITNTPNIDRLAKEGIQFTDFHVAPMCTPTRGQLLTGMDAFRNGAINVSSGRTLLRPELKTMANIFQDNNYATGLFGKWHLGDNYPFRPEDRGFEKAIWFPSSHINSLPDYWDNDYFDDTYIHKGQKESFKGYCTDVFFDESIKWMKARANSEKPFFTYIALNAAHWPHFVPNRYRDPIRKAMEKKPELFENLDEKKRRELVSFLAMGANIDENMGKLLDFLDESGLDENTIVVFLTDNGSTFGKDYFNAGMKGGKTTLWEGGHRVPLLMKTPERSSNRPEKIDELCHVQDLLPTLASMSGITDIPQKLDGVDLSPLLTGEKEKLDDRMLVINYSRMPMFEVNYTTKNPAIPMKNGAGVLWKNWRLLENRELYDISTDPYQDDDVAAENPEVVAKMRAHLDNWWDEVKDEVYEPQRVVIGSEHENPMLISACEWLDVFVDQQIQTRYGPKKNGIWHLFVAKAGEYEFELRRWPRESGFRLRQGIPEKKVTDGTFIEGTSFPIFSARMKAGNEEKSIKTSGGDVAVNFTFELEKGNIEIQSWFNDENGESILGAYYMYVTRK